MFKRLDAAKIGTSAYHHSISGKFIAVKGVVVRLSCIQSELQQMCFTCAVCDVAIVESSIDGELPLVTGCTTEFCKSRSFHPTLESAHTTFRDVQKLRCGKIVLTYRLQELSDEIGNDLCDFGRIPRIFID